VLLVMRNGLAGSLIAQGAKLADTELRAEPRTFRLARVIFPGVGR
jgi:hypothetical protein